VADPSPEGINNLNERENYCKVVTTLEKSVSEWDLEEYCRIMPISDYVQATAMLTATDI
jgi:hypothetical protein